MERLQPKYYLIIYITACIISFYLFVDAYWAFDSKLFITQKMTLITQKKTHYWDISLYLFWLLLLIAVIFAWHRRIRLYFVLVWLFAFGTSAGYVVLLEKSFLFKKISGLWSGSFSLSFLACIIPTAIATFVVYTTYKWLPLVRAWVVGKRPNDTTPPVG